MPNLIVVENPDNWPLAMRGVELVAAQSYLTDARYSELDGAVVFNLCRSYGYQRTGYYVSLLAEARGHRPQPSVATLQEFRNRSVLRVASDELGNLIRTSLAPVRSKEFQLSVYFGLSLAERHRRLALALYNLFPAPLLRARFLRKGREWQLQQVGPVAANDVPESHRELVVEAAEAQFARKRWPVRRRTQPRCHLAILQDPDEEEPPSDETALRRFERAATRLGMATERIDRNDYARIPEFDALFIRATTYVNHYTYRFASRAEAEGLVVIDDPSSIIRCTNKVYLNEVLERRRVPTPRTMIVHRDNRDEVASVLGLPCVLKRPDSSFSVGVVKADTPDELERGLGEMLDDSELVVAQEFVPTEYDWRVGILDGEPLYVCRYFMAPRHWQILHHRAGKSTRYGRVEALSVEDAPRGVVRTALRAAGPIGRGFYGVDLKQFRRRSYVMEVNDNPSVEAGCEDRVLGGELYERVMRVFLERVEARRSKT